MFQAFVMKYKLVNLNILTTLMLFLALESMAQSTTNSQSTNFYVEAYNIRG
ncbi:MAG: hypothetical protein RL253_756, partial [Bacteroidota bacterium]